MSLAHSASHLTGQWEGHQAPEVLFNCIYLKWTKRSKLEMTQADRPTCSLDSFFIQRHQSQSGKSTVCLFVWLGFPSEELIVKLIISIQHMIKMPHVMNGYLQFARGQNKMSCLKGHGSELITARSPYLINLQIEQGRTQQLHAGFYMFYSNYQMSL